ncbi:MAG: response regulator [Candidatus Eisenbacteria bacterium]|nr:response regulator [Candidatus Eisenbacteria bacterium]
MPEPENIHDPANANQTAAVRNWADILAIADAIPTPLLVVGRDGGISFFNAAWLRLTGRPLAGELGRGWLSGVHEEEREATDEAFGQAVQRREALDVEFRILCADGEHRWMHAQGVPLYSPAGDLAGVVGSCVDVSDRRRLQEENDRYFQDLEEAKQRAETAASELIIQAEELALARNVAQKATQTKSIFLANMSHEMRNSMNGILGMTTLLLDTTLTDDQRQYVEAMHESARHLVTELNDLLELSKIEEGQIAMRAEPFSPREVANSLVLLFGPEAERKGLHLTTEVDWRVPAIVIGDEPRLRQVLTNLLSNAIKYTEQGEIRFAVRSKGTTAQRSLIQFEVKDTGVGISEEKQRTLFEAWRPEHLETERRFQGSGLGLSLTWQLIARMMGKIWVESQPSQGSSFHIVLPFTAPSEEQVTEYHSSRRAAHSGVIAGSSGDTLRVLLAEDSRVGQLLVTRLLEKWGHDCSVVASGVDAIEAARRSEWDLILMDVQMPEMDGWTATRAIRKLPGPAGQVRILALTAFAMEEDRRKCLEAGMNGYLSKPIAPKELKTALDGLIAERRAA